MMKGKQQQQRRSLMNIAGALLALVGMVALWVLVKTSSLVGEPETIIIDERGSIASVDTLMEDLQQWLMESEELKQVIETHVEKRKFRKLTEIMRVTQKEMPFRRFYEEFEKKGVPVVITNVSYTTGHPWTREYIDEMCGDAVVKPLVPSKVAGSKWANLRRMNTSMYVTDFLKMLETKSGEDSPYMHDWPLPHNCPRLLRDYVIPKYFTQDFLKHASIPATKLSQWGATRQPYAHSWPSLFIGETKTGSGLHVDSADTHFVMHMIEGSKEFRTLRRPDRIVAYEDRNQGTFPTSLFEPDFKRFPLLALAEVFHTTLHAGDLLFIPGGSPHQVVNHSPVISISTNYVDSSNIDRVTQQFEQQSQPDMADALTKASRSNLFHTIMTPNPVLWSPVE